MVKSASTRKPFSVFFDPLIEREAFLCLSTEKKSSDFKCPSSLCLPVPFISSTEIEVISTIKFPEDGISFMNVSSPDSNFKLP